MADPHDDPRRQPPADPRGTPSGPEAAEGLGTPDLDAAARLFGLALPEAQRAAVVRAWAFHRDAADAIARQELPNGLAPAVAFSALLPGAPLPPSAPEAAATPSFGRTPEGARDAVHLTVAEQARALRSGALTSRALTEAYLDRIERLDADLLAFVTVLPERARAEARRADEELAGGRDRGPLHGIPYAAKDLLDVPGAPTTWGAAPFRDRTSDEPATAVRRMQRAGAVLLGKTALGELAMGDVWFRGTTRNPWNPDEGASGSSAGSAAAVAAGLCSFALGSETMGSILSPAGRCGVVGLRPTFGRVSRHGAMALAWSMDRLGPLARSVEDAALVLRALQGPDGRDDTVVEAPFPWDPGGDAGALRIGVPEDDLHEPDAALAAFLDASQGAAPVPLHVPGEPLDAVMTILMVEAAAAFDATVRGGGLDALRRQDEESWPVLLRAARLVPATDYLQAQRLRRRLQVEAASLFDDVDVILTRNDDERALLLGNAAGLPAVSLPCGRSERGRPLGNVALLARPFFDHLALLAAHGRSTGERPPAVPPGFETDA